MGVRVFLEWDNRIKKGSRVVSQTDLAECFVCDLANVSGKRKWTKNQSPGQVGFSKHPGYDD